MELLSINEASDACYPSRGAMSKSNLMSRPRGRSLGDRASSSLFFLLVFAWSWLWWLAAGMTGMPVTEPPATWMFLLGGLGPVMAAVLLVIRHYPEEPRHDFWQRLWDPRRISWRWWLIIPLVAAGPTVFGWLLTSGGEFEAGVGSTGAATVGVFAWLVFAAGAALAEEPGWRGYALDALLRHRGVLFASLSLGVVWASWHLPQFFLEGSYQHDEVGFATGPFWMFMTAIVAQTFLYVWVVTNTRGSILAAMVFHALTNLAGELLDPSAAGELVALVVWVVAAMALGVYWQKRDRISSSSRERGVLQKPPTTRCKI